jgi:hypothetical protein
MAVSEADACAGPAAISKGGMKMKNVTRGDGRKERFSRHKIAVSLEALGLDRRKALRIARSITYHKGITTEEIRFKVGYMLRRIDKKLSKRYLASRDLTPRENESGIWGKALMTEKDMERIDVRIGQEVEATDGEKSVTLRAYAIDDPYYKKGSVYISEHDLGMLHHGFGSRIMLRKRIAAA